jgi:hypothetical protein
MEENTSFQLSYSVNDGIVEIVFTGEITKSTHGRLRAEVITILRENNAAAVLCDVRAMRGPNEIVDAFKRVTSIPSDVASRPCAIVESAVNREFQLFYEATAANAGQSMKYFTDIETARCWLKSRHLGSHFGIDLSAQR